jgi:chromosome segregation ATPase
MSSDESHLRRSEDRDRALNQRLDKLEESYLAMTMTVTKLQTDVNVVKLEQSHLKEIFESRMRVLERGQDLQLSKIDQVSKDLQTIASDIEKTPLGRTLTGYIHDLQERSNAQALTLKEHENVFQQLVQWQNGIESVLSLFKWIGAGTLLTVLAFLFKVLMLKGVP